MRDSSPEEKPSWLRKLAAEGEANEVRPSTPEPPGAGCRC
jgi:hypothetical protein